MMNSFPSISGAASGYILRSREVSAQDDMSLVFDDPMFISGALDSGKDPFMIKKEEASLGRIRTTWFPRLCAVLRECYSRGDPHSQ